jgi:beta-xylosidase
MRVPLIKKYTVQSLLLARQYNNNIEAMVLTVLQNLIIPGFAPDPSIVRIGEEYFLVTSSFHLFPGLPIYSSKDLVTWKYFGLSGSADWLIWTVTGAN